jgi:transcriptional regulator of NAD metabolism
MKARLAELSGQRSRTQLMPPGPPCRRSQQQQARPRPAQRWKPKEKKYRVIQETVVIAGKEYSHKVFIPAKRESKLQKFVKALNK